MAKIDARDWIFQIQTGPTAWTEIGGITTWELDPAAGTETTDDTTFKSKGRQEGHVAQRGASINLEGFYEYADDDETLTERDPGQLAVDALGDQVGRASLGGFRFRHDDQAVWTVWAKAHVDLGAVGGGNNDNTSWSATFTRSGSATTAAVAP